MEVHRGGGSHPNGVSNNHNKTTQGTHDSSDKQQNTGKYSATEISRSVEIKSTRDALNALSLQGTNEWLDRRSNESSIYSQQVVNYESEDNRLASFLGRWPEDATVTPAELASAGLYFTGPNDRVQCAYCKGAMYNWAAGDTAIGEHIRHFPKCQFIQNKMTELVNPREIKSSKQTISSHDDTHSSTMQIVEDMGYEKALVQKAMERLIESDVQISVDKLLDVVFELENDEEQSQASENEQDHLKDSETESEAKVQEATSISEAIKIAEPLHPPSGVKQLKAENDNLKDKTLCKVCMDAELNMLFLPCRHLACCQTCGSMVKHCPVCRTLIVGTVNTFLV